jgi:4-amino-4-deoxy-L-arabinose transferase-like glycosyltransferase
MQWCRSNGQVICAIALVALVAGAGGCWRLCTRSGEMAYLPSHSGAQWIVDARLPETRVRHAFPSSMGFKRTFLLNAKPAEATISLSAFKSAALSVNGQAISCLKCSRNWKVTSMVSIGPLLLAGTNEIVVSVTNDFGPPALWLRLQAGPHSLGTDESWLSSPVDSHWLAARRASAPLGIPTWYSLNEQLRASDAILRSWHELVLFMSISLALILFIRRWLKMEITVQPAKRLYVLFAAVVIARVALFIHDVPGLSHEKGFDAQPHEKYIKFIQEKGALPLPQDGWEMHQPPLYYLVSALLMDELGFSAGKDNAVMPLRAINGVIGLLHCWLVLLCLQRLFPENQPAQAVGLLIASFLPANLYISMYVTNDPLVGLLVTLSIYLLLHLLASEKENPKLAIGLGLALGAAMLTKLTAMLAVPVILAALGVRLVLRKARSPGDWLRSVGVVTLACALTCGWHYIRVWGQIGSLPLPNSQTNPALVWWQDPGFRTANYYLRFGRSLVSPLFSGFHSFADGIYSTLWADGLISGGSSLVFRPPWNYDLVRVGCLLSVPLTLLAALGLAISIRKLMRQPEPVSVLVVGMLFAFAAGIIFLTFHSPWQSAVKAFYAIPALVPFSALIAAGWLWLAKKHRALRMALWLILLIWIFTTFSSLWIRTDNSEFWRSRGLVQMSRHDFPAAIENFSRALELNSDDPVNRYLLARALEYQGKAKEALQEYEEALRLEPDSPDTLAAAAEALTKGEKEDAVRATKLAQRACELTHYRRPSLVNTLAVAQSGAGQMEESLMTFELACNLAINGGETDLPTKYRENLAAKLDQYARILASNPGAASGEGPRAVQFAQHACELTEFHNTVFIGTLAAAYAKAGEIDKAIGTAQKACGVATSNGETNLLQNNLLLLQSYRARKPVREEKSDTSVIQKRRP